MRTLEQTSRVLANPVRMMEPLEQKFDTVSDKLNIAFERFIDRIDRTLHGLSGRLRTPQSVIQTSTLSLQNMTGRLAHVQGRLVTPYQDKLESLNRMLETLSYKSVLNRGYTVLRDDNGHVLETVKSVEKAQSVTAEVKDGKAKIR
jgi:exodeoxyribonuclease VII large subunit